MTDWIEDTLEVGFETFEYIMKPIGYVIVRGLMLFGCAWFLLITSPVLLMGAITRFVKWVKSKRS